MKKVVYILTLAVAMAMAACNTSNESSEASSASSDASANNAVATTSEANSAEANEAAISGNEVNVSTPDVAPQPGTNQAAPAAPKLEPKAPFTPEEAAKYKDAIGLVKNYSEEVNKVLDAKMNGKAIDEAAKQRITEIQNKLADLQKSGKMNDKLLELKKISDDVYSKVLTK